MEFIEDVIFQGEPEPVRIRPVKPRVHYLGRAMDALGLVSGDRIGSLLMTVETVKVEAINLYILD
jgi:hypothetical protein